MTDARWFEVDADIADAVDHFSRASEIAEKLDMDADGLVGYTARMGFMHAMQSGHTSLEAALVRILEMLNEERPSGEHWHADLIRRVSRELPGRPAILSGEVAIAADETRRFRNLAIRGYGGFDPGRASPAVQAATCIATQITGMIRQFRDVIDPEYAADDDEKNDDAGCATRPPCS